MVFDKITGDGRLWAVRFDENADNEFIKTIDQWDDVQWLRAFFIENISDLIAYFKISDINIAISDTIDDSDRLQRIILDISPEADLNRIFRPLDNNQASDAMLQKEKARLKRKYGHSSWLRLYAIKLVSGVYIITRRILGRGGLQRYSRPNIWSTASSIESGSMLQVSPDFTSSSET